MALIWVFGFNELEFTNEHGLEELRKLLLLVVGKKLNKFFFRFMKGQALNQYVPRYENKLFDGKNR